MARIDSNGKIRGKIANSVYRVVGNENIIQHRPKKAKQTEASKESSQEFGLASSTTKQIRAAFSAVYHMSDGGMINRCTQTVLKSIRSCLSKGKLERDLHDGDLDFLKGFQFNADSPLWDVLSARPKVEMGIDGTIIIRLPGFRDFVDLKGPSNRAGCYLRIVAVAFDFKNHRYDYLSRQELEIQRGAKIEDQEWQIKEELVPGTLILISLSIDFFSFCTYFERSSLNSKIYSPCEIIGAFHVTENINLQVDAAQQKDHIL